LRATLVAEKTAPAFRKAPAGTSTLSTIVAPAPMKQSIPRIGFSKHLSRQLVR